MRKTAYLLVPAVILMLTACGNQEGAPNKEQGITKVNNKDVLKSEGGLITIDKKPYSTEKPSSKSSSLKPVQNEGDSVYQYGSGSAVPPNEGGMPAPPPGSMDPNREQNGTENGTLPQNEPPAAGDNTGIEAQVIDLTNKEREKNGLPALQSSQQVSNVAREKSQDMEEKNYFSHTSPTYGSPFDMMQRFGVQYETAGENIAMGQKTPEEVVKAWMDSEGHRKNILNGTYTEIGVGYNEEGQYWTQMFISK